jgi:hypothetical protein
MRAGFREIMWCAVIEPSPDIRGDQSVIGRRTIVYRSPSGADIPGAADSMEVPVISAGEGHK